MATRPQPGLPYGAAHGIVTPEAVFLELDTAGVGSRAIGRVIDTAAQLAGLFAVTLALTSLFSFGGFPAWLAIAFVVVGIFAVVLGYSMAFEALWGGRTPGKAAMGLRVVTAEGAPIRFRHAALRAIFAIPDFLVIGPAVAIVAALLTRRTQRLGDLVAGTIVLRERTATAAPRAVAFHHFPGWEQYASTLDVAPLTAPEYGLIRSFLMRVGDLQPGARGQLAARIGAGVAAKIHHTIPPGVHPEHFLVTVAAAYQQRFEAMGPVVTAVPAAVPPAPPSGSAPGSFAPIDAPATDGPFAPPA